MTTHTQKEIWDSASAEDTEPRAQTITETEAPEPAQEPIRYFFMAAVKVVFVREDKAREKTVNVLMDLGEPNIVRKTINDINRSAMKRVISETGITAEDIRDSIILNVWPMAACTATYFHEAAPINEDSEREVES